MKGFPAITLAAMLVLSAFSFVLAASVISTAGDGPVVIRGYVTDLQGVPLSSANVTVVVKDNTTGAARANETYITESSGFYTVVFEPFDWDIGNIAEVTAQRDGDYGSNYTSLQYLHPVCYVNITYPLKITAPTSQVFALSLVLGWNFVSVPLVNHGYKASTLGLQRLDLVVSWNPATAVYDNSFIIGVSPPSADFDIAPNTGYWVHTYANQTLNLTGSMPVAPQSRTVNLQTGGGWVNIGLNTLNTTWKASVIPKMYSGGNITVVAWYNSIAMTYRTYVAGVPPSDFTLVPGQAYWCYCTSSGTLTYSP